MVIDLSDIIKDYGARRNVSFSVLTDDIEFMGETYVFAKPLLIEGYIQNNTKSLELSASLKGEMGVHCALCRKSITKEIDFPIDELIAIGESDDEDVISLSDEMLDLGEIVKKCIYMNVSGKYKCSENCRGLCPKCGCNRNDESC